MCSSELRRGVVLIIGKDSSQFGERYGIARRRKRCLEIHCFVDKRLVGEKYLASSKDLAMRGYERTTLFSVHCNVAQNMQGRVNININLTSFAKIVQPYKTKQYNNYSKSYINDDV